MRGGVVRRLAAAARSSCAALVGLVVDDVVLVVGVAVSLALTWGLWRVGWVPAGALGFVLFGLVAATLAASLRHAARAARPRRE